MLSRSSPIAMAVIVTTSLVLGACGGSTSASDSAPPPPESAPTATVDPTSSDPALDTGSPTPATPPAAPPTRTPTPEPATPLLTAAGVTAIELLTPTVGNRRYALLEWSAVPGAAEYTVSVFHPDGQAWWAWSGRELAVTLGGLDTDLDLGGPQAGEGVTWFVVARDDQGALLGVSARQAIA